MTTDRGVVRKIAWSEVFPWLILLRTFRIAISPSVLALATLATLLAPIGDRLGAIIFLPRKQVGDRQVIDHPADKSPPLLSHLPTAVIEYLPDAETGLVAAFVRIVDPLYRVFQLNLSYRDVAYYAFTWLWSLAIWAFVGGAITRIALVRLATDDPPDLLPTLKLAGRRYLWYFLSPLYPLLGVMLIAAPIALLGLPLWLHAGLGSILVGLLWILVLLASVAAVFLLAGLLFGWPLMWPVISAESDAYANPFEAFSRSFSYVYGKPLHYLFYFLVAATFGALCLAVVQGAAILITEFSWWALSWGSGEEAATQLRNLARTIVTGGDVPNDVNRLALIGAMGVALGIGLVNAIIVAFTFSYLWCVASAIYLLMRYDVDEKEMDEVYFDPVPRETPLAPQAPLPKAETPVAEPPAVPPPLPPESQPPP